MSKCTEPDGQRRPRFEPDGLRVPTQAESNVPTAHQIMIEAEGQCPWCGATV